MLLLFLSLQRLPEVAGISFSSFWLDAEEPTEEDVSFVIVDVCVAKVLFNQVLNRICRSDNDQKSIDCDVWQRYVVRCAVPAIQFWERFRNTVTAMNSRHLNLYKQT